MPSDRLEVVFAPDSTRRKLEVSPTRTETPLTTLLAEIGKSLNMRCGGRGLCQGCRVRFQSGALRHLADGRVVTTSGETEISSCQYAAIPGESAVITVPATSQLGHAAQIADDFKTRVPVARAPLFAPPAVAAAIDIGTTTVAVLLAEVESGKILARASAMNRQISMGDNVVTRINHCMTDKVNISELQKLILRETVLPLLRKACADAGLALADIAGLVMAGNTVMLHLLAGVDPTPMGAVPFTPAFLDHRRLRASDLNLADILPADREIHLLPGLAAYIGADINAGIVATGMHYEEGPNLLIDIGTNGEIALKFGDRLIGCATAAGPAFEGAGLARGTRAVDGAIAEIELGREPFACRLKRINENKGGACPGICGSAYIDFLGEGVRHGLFTPAGRFARDFLVENPDCVQTIDGERVFVLLPSRESPTQAIGISELDISRLLQAKAAIAAGFSTLLTHEGLKPSDIRKLYLAGGFGLHLNVTNAIACGLLPGFVPEQIEVVGNTSLAGAYMTLQDRGVLDELRHNQNRMEVVELNLDPSFEDCYIENLMLEVD
ncbi:MAG: ASKHA domain-containing protein [Methylacidiphilales bacterium]|nr:ASKHA domain-containing protein [Candidatus Methylacidiphilales bacterium]